MVHHSKEEKNLYSQKEEIIYTVALDIGTTKICGAVGKIREHYKTIEIISFAEVKCDGVKYGLIENVENTSNAIYEVLLKLAKEIPITIGEVYVGISGKHIVPWNKQHSIILQEEYAESEHIITKNDIENLKESLKKRMLPDIKNNIIIGLYPQHFKIDNNAPVDNPIGMSGSRLGGHFMVITTSESSINKINWCIDIASKKIDSTLHYVAKEGIHVKYLFQGIASGLSVLNEDEMEGGTCVIDIGGGTSDYVIFEKNIVRSAGVFAVGGERVTEDIKEGCGIKFSEAERIKVESGFAHPTDSPEQEQMVVVSNSFRDERPHGISKKILVDIIHDRLFQIIEWMHTQMIGNGYIKKITRYGIVLTGGGSNLNGMKSFVEIQTGLLVRIGYPNEHINSLKIRSITDPKYSTLIGLLIEGMRDAKNDILNNTQRNTAEQTKEIEKPKMPPTTPPKKNITDSWYEKTQNAMKKLGEKAKGLLTDDIK